LHQFLLGSRSASIKKNKPSPIFTDRLRLGIRLSGGKSAQASDAHSRTRLKIEVENYYPETNGTIEAGLM